MTLQYDAKFHANRTLNIARDLTFDNFFLK
jgi:hypothetical protein